MHALKFPRRATLDSHPEQRQSPSLRDSLLHDRHMLELRSARIHSQLSSATFMHVSNWEPCHRFSESDPRCSDSHRSPMRSSHSCGSHGRRTPPTIASQHRDEQLGNVRCTRPSPRPPARSVLVGRHLTLADKAHIFVTAPHQCCTESAYPVRSWATLRSCACVLAAEHAQRTDAFHHVRDDGTTRLGAAFMCGPRGHQSAHVQAPMSASVFSAM